ncbi:MAG: hypothetical protein M1835_002652, partial [Candelina submexicana]
MATAVWRLSAYLLVFRGGSRGLKSTVASHGVTQRLFRQSQNSKVCMAPAWIGSHVRRVMDVDSIQSTRTSIAEFKVYTDLGEDDQEAFELGRSEVWGHWGGTVENLGQRKEGQRTGFSGGAHSR